MTQSKKPRTEEDRVVSYSPPDGSSSSGGDAIDLNTREYQAVASVTEKVANWAWRKHMLGYFLLALGVKAYDSQSDFSLRLNRVSVDSARVARLNAIEMKFDAMGAKIDKLTANFEDRTTAESRAICSLQTPAQQRLGGLPCEDLLAGRKWQLIEVAPGHDPALFTRAERY